MGRIVQPPQKADHRVATAGRSTIVKKTIAYTTLCLGILLVSSSAAFAVCVKASTANLREGPGTNHAKSWVVYRYMPFKKIGKKDDWVNVEDVDGYKHWIHDDLVTDDVRCAVVKKDKINVRSGPGTKFSKTALSPVEKYYAFKIVETKGSWVKVQDEVNNEGWILDSLLWIQ